MVEKISVSLYPEDLAKLDLIEQAFCPKGINYSRSARIKVAIQLAYDRALALQDADNCADEPDYDCCEEDKQDKHTHLTEYCNDDCMTCDDASDCLYSLHPTKYRLR